MKRSTKYGALHVHQASAVASVREESGRVIARSVLPTAYAARLPCKAVPESGAHPPPQRDP